MDRYKDMQYGEYIDGEFVEYEDMTEDQLMELHALDVEKLQREHHAEWWDRLEEEYNTY